MFGPPLPMETLVSAPIYLLSHKRRICNSCVVYINIVCTKGQCVKHVRWYIHINMAFILKQSDILTTKASDDIEYHLLPSSLFRSQPWGGRHCCHYLYLPFGHLLLTAFPLIISEVAALSCQ